MAKESKNTGDRNPQIVQIGKHLQHLRKQLGYTSAEKFAWENNINRVQYWRMENGQNFSLESLLKVLDAMHISLQEFFSSLDS
ncbi:MAG: XRE family transcriptional regulator [Bacteroidetes bacterium]|nr:XRE family transcriptional regulator [Bacteroidota bacterium]